VESYEDPNDTSAAKIKTPGLEIQRFLMAKQQPGTKQQQGSQFILNSFLLYCFTAL